MTSEELKAERIRLGVTRREMATALGVSVKAYGVWEYKRRPPAVIDAALETARQRIAQARDKLAGIEAPPLEKPAVKKPSKPKVKKKVWGEERSENAFELLNRFTSRKKEEPFIPEAEKAEPVASNRPAISPIVRLKVEERIAVALDCYGGNVKKVHKLLAQGIAAADIHEIAKQTIRPLISGKAIEKIQALRTFEKVKEITSWSTQEADG